MDWMTIAWPMVIAACLTLALINMRIALGEVRRAPHVFFFLSALAIAWISGLELLVLRSESVEECRSLLRWAAIPITIMVTSVAGFVWSLFGTGRRWLAVAGTAMNGVAELANFFSKEPAVRNPVALKQVTGIGGVTFSVPQIEGSVWTTVEIVGVLLVILFVADASIALLKKGQGRRAIIVGGSIVFFFLASRGQAALVEGASIPMPYLTSFAFLAVLIAMGHELSDDVFRAAKLSRDLQESEERMDLAAHAASLGFWTWDLQRDEIWASETARNLFQVPMEERVDISRFFQSVHPDDREGVQKAIQAALAGGMKYEREYRVLLKEGGVRWIAARGRVELSGGGRPVLMRGVLLDITARRQSETEMQQLRGQLAHAGRVSMMGQLASALAHELNQPLGAILRNAEAAELFMQDAEPNLDEVRAIIADIRKDDQRAGEVIDRLRALLKRRDIETRSLSVSVLLEEVRALTRADAAARGVKLEIQCAPDLPAIRGDRVHLQQVLINLIINGMDALSEPRRDDARVIVSARRARPGFVEVAVTDNGHGIPSDRLASVFDPFFTTKPHGMGMGLPISRTIIQTHGGHITAENVEGGGAAFRFTLPEDGDRNTPSI